MKHPCPGICAREQTWKPSANVYLALVVRDEEVVGHSGNTPGLDWREGLLIDHRHRCLSSRYSRVLSLLGVAHLDQVSVWIAWFGPTPAPEWGDAGALLVGIVDTKESCH